MRLAVASFAGSDGRHFSTDDYEQLGRSLLLALHDTVSISDSQRDRQMENLRMFVSQRADPDSESEGSDAEPEEACLPPDELAACWEQLAAEIPAAAAEQIVLDIASGLQVQVQEPPDCPSDIEAACEVPAESSSLKPKQQRRSSQPIKFGPEDRPGGSRLGRALTPPKLLAPVSTSAVHATSLYDTAPVGM